MPTDIAPFVTPTYDAVISVADDTEVLDEVSLRGTAQALANRIEFVRDHVPDASDNPERIYGLREDFIGVDDNISGGFLRCDSTVWRTARSGGPIVSNSSPNVKNPGSLDIFMPGDSATNEFYFFLTDDTGKVVSASFTTMTTIVAKVGLDGGVAAQFAWGWAQDGDALNGGTNTLSLVYTSFNANWQILLRRSSVQSFIDTGVPAVIGEYVVCRFLLKASNDIDVELDGSIVTTILSANKPLGDMTFGGRFVTTIADAAPATVHTDFMFFSADSGNRSGP